MGKHYIRGSRKEKMKINKVDKNLTEKSEKSK